MTETITSKNNDLLTHIRKLQASRSYRYENRQLVGEGDKLLLEAINGKPEIVLMTEGSVFPPLPDLVRKITISAQLMKSVSLLTTPQNALFVCSMPEEKEISDVAPSLVLDGVQDPGNLGTMLRTADALGIEKVILCQGCADPYGPKTVRATMGAIFRQSIYQMSRQELILKAKAKSSRLIATALSDTARDVTTVSLRDAAVIIGSEGGGVSRELLDAADQHVIIPISKSCESLNAAVAAAIIMWEMKK